VTKAVEAQQPQKKMEYRAVGNYALTTEFYSSQPTNPTTIKLKKKIK
jgi:hypothetical protein